MAAGHSYLVPCGQQRHHMGSPDLTRALGKSMALEQALNNI